MYRKQARPRGRTVIAAGTAVHGNINGRGTLEVQGYVHGDIDQDGQMRVAAGAVCHGNLRAAGLQVEGEIHGEVEVAGLLEIRPTGRLYGHVRCGRLRVHEGAVFRGSNEMVAEKSRSARGSESLAPEPVPQQPHLQ